MDQERLTYWGTTYQIYPRSFFDSNDDGIGDLRGIIERLEYVKNLGIDTIWVSPFYKSPWQDGGYDVESYDEITPQLGTNKDFDDLIAKTHRLGMKICVEIIPHLSVESKQFKDALKSKASPYRNWFLFADPAPGLGGPKSRPPNNWPSEFRQLITNKNGEVVKKQWRSAWQWLPSQKQFVLCSFTPYQVDLNWRNENVREFIFGTMTKLMDRGIDAFRFDSYEYIGKNIKLLDEPLNPIYPAELAKAIINKTPTSAELTKQRQLIKDELDIVQDINRVRDKSMFTWLHELQDVLKQAEAKDKKYHRVVLEGYNAGAKGAVELAKKVDQNLIVAFDFNLIKMGDWNLEKLQKYLDIHLKSGVSFQPASDNHDKPRSVSRFGKNSTQVARAIIVLLATLPGNPTFYQGQELGLPSAKLPRRIATDPDDRDQSRTPIPWNSSVNGGFSTKEPWLPVPEEHIKLNIESQTDALGSTLELTRACLNLRKQFSWLAFGDYSPVKSKSESTSPYLAFRRSNEPNQQIIVVVNGEKSQVLNFSQLSANAKVLVSSLSTSWNKSIDLAKLKLAPNEALVIELSQPD